MKKKIIESFKTPLKENKIFLDIFIGGVFLFFPIIQLLSLGYLTKKLKNIIELDKTQVKWDENFKELFIWGIKGFLIILSYLIIPLLFILLGDIYISHLAEGKILSLFFFRGQVLILLGTILFLIAAFFLPMGFCLFLEENKIEKSFDLRETLTRILLVARDYSIAYLVILGIYIFSITLTILMMNWVVGLILGAFLYFYNSLVTVYLLGKIFPRKSVKIKLPPTK